MQVAADQGLIFGAIAIVVETVGGHWGRWLFEKDLGIEDQSGFERQVLVPVA